MQRPDESMGAPTLTTYILSLLQEQEKQVTKTGSGCDVIDYSLPYSAMRQIRIDNQRNYVLVYTYDNAMVVNIEEKDKVMLYAAHVNEGLSLTGLELNLERCQYKYKSSQAFPQHADPTEVVRYFIRLHDGHFPTLRSNINEFERTGKDPLVCAKELVKAIRDIKIL